MKVVPPTAPANEPPELVFQWERRTHAHWRLVGIVALALLAHAIVFYVLQVSYTPTGSQLPPPAQVVMIPLHDPDHEALARWLAMADPSLIVQPAPPSPADTIAALNFRYVPSYEATRPGFKSLDPSAIDPPVTNPPRPHPPGPVPTRLDSRLVPAPSAPPAEKTPGTRVILSGDIQARLAGPLPPVVFTASAAGKRLLEPTAFLVGVRPGGGPPFLFQKASPDGLAVDHTVADDYARAYLGQLEFQPAAHPTDAVLWGSAEFAWGNEIYR